MARTPVLLLLALLAAGEPAPEPGIDTWIAAPEGSSLADLRGRAVLLLLDGAGESRVEAWNDLRAAYLADGLRVVAVLGAADAAPATAEYSLAVGSAGELAAGGEPRAVLVAPDGSVAWAGKPGDLTDEPIADALRKVREFDLRTVRPALRDAAKEYERGKLAEARSLALAAAAAAADDLDGADAGFVAGRCDATLACWKSEAERAAARGDPAQALFHLDRIAKHFAGTDDAEAAKQRAVEIRSDPASEREEKAADQYARAREDLRKAGDKEKKVEAWRKRAEGSAEKASGTRGAERISRLVESTREDPVLAEIRAFIATSKILKSAATWRKSLPKPPKAAFPAGKSYFWILETSCGSMKLRLRPDVAPMHVSSTIFLTEVGFYDGLTFHRVIPGFMAQGGCPDGDGTGDPGYSFDGEFSDSAKHDGPGVLSMANRGPGTDGSQFFITYTPRANLDGKHTVFGTLVSGMETLLAIEKLGSPDGPTKERVEIRKASILVE